MNPNNQNKMYKWANDLFPICRSITGEGVRKTLNYCKNLHPEILIKKFHSGEKVFDWVIPDEWNIKDAYVSKLNGEKIIDFKNNNLHIVSYSIPINKIVSKKELLEHIHTRHDIPDAIPYITSYYSKDWGFCISENFKKTITENEYKVVIESSLKKGEMNYGECLIQGKSKKEIVFSTYICHPSMANNELSGIVVSLSLIENLKNSDNYYSYRFLFLPETIGSIAYISKNLKNLKKNTLCGFVLTCMGNKNNFSYMPSRTGNTYTDKVILHCLNKYGGSFKSYSFLDRGSDERQFCSPLVDLPFASIMKSKYKEYKEYHTSLDNMSFLDSNALSESRDILLKCIYIIENNFFPKLKLFCEPMLSKRNLYPKFGGAIKSDKTKLIKNLIAYSDGKLDLIDLCELFDVDFTEICKTSNVLVENNLLSKKLI
jgi:aminopeptidase-like protein